MDIEKTVKNLKVRGFQVSCFETGAKAAEYLNSCIKGCSVGIGGSKTVESLGLYETLSENNTVYWHWKVPGRPTLDSAATTDIYMCSANAISEDGEIFNIDGNGNRVAAMCFGPKSVVIVAGMNKVVKDMDEAYSRVRNYTSPAVVQRFPDAKTPCNANGLCADCKGTDSCCCYMVETRLCRPAGKIKVVLVGEDLGL